MKIGIDLGTANIIVYVKGQGIVMHDDALALDVDDDVGRTQVYTDLHTSALSPFRKSFDPGPEFQEFRVDLLIAAMDVVSAPNRGDSVGGQSSKDKRRARSKVADLDFGTVERGRTGDDGVMLVHDLNIGAHAAQLAQPRQRNV